MYLEIDKYAEKRYTKFDVLTANMSYINYEGKIFVIKVYQYPTQI